MKRAVVIGGGISGLVAAYRLSRFAQGCYEISLLEASDRLGGKILTEYADGCVFELGPDSFLTAKPYALDLVNDLGLDSKLVGTRPENSDVFVYTRGRLRRIPEGLSLMAPSRLYPFLRSDLFTWKGKLRMALDYFLPVNNLEDESMGHFARRRLGKEALDTLVQPVMAGIYAGDAEQLSLKSTFPRFLEMERRYGSVIQGLRKGTNERSAKSTHNTLFMSLAGGLGELTQTLTKALENIVRLSTPVRSIVASGPGYRLTTGSGEELAFDAVIAATPAWQTARLVSGLDPELALNLDQIPFSSSATISLVYDAGTAPRLQPGFGYVVARDEMQWISAATFSSMKFPGRAPEGTFLIRCFLGGIGKENILERNDSEIIEGVLNDVRRQLGIDVRPKTYRFCRWERANPQYTMGHEAKLGRIERCLRSHAGLSLAGASYRGIGIPDCIASGFEAAQATHAYLAG